MKRSSSIGFLKILISVLLTAAAFLPGTDGSASGLEDLVIREGKTRLLAGNHVETLFDGPESFTRRLELVRSAKHHLLISTFIWRKDDYGLEMLDAVATRIEEVAADGGQLKVLIILDDTTPQASNDFWSSVRRRLRSIGAEVRYFNPPRWGLVPIYGARLHDKVMIADGKTAIVGGRNYSDHYFVDQGPTVWFDADILIEGPAVEDLQMHWLKSWVVLKRMRSLKRFLSSPEKTLSKIKAFWRHGVFPDGATPLDDFADREWFPRHEPHGSVNAAILYDNPLVWDHAPTVDVVTALVDGARSEVDIVTPFPNFPPRLMASLQSAVERGVRVRVLTNSETNAVRGGIHWRSLLPAIVTMGDAGVKVWGWAGGNGNPEATAALRACDATQKPFTGIHAKLFQVDQQVAIVTASNFNVRSTWYNTEAGVLVADSSVAAEIKSVTDRMTGTTPMTLECRDGEELVLAEPSLFFDEAMRKDITAELGDSTPRLESYGPAF